MWEVLSALRQEQELSQLVSFTFRLKLITVSRKVLFNSTERKSVYRERLNTTKSIFR